MADPTPAPDDAPVASATALVPAAAPSAASTAARAGVPVPTAQARTAAAPAGESRTVRLYRAALGPVGTARYLQVFARFDAAGRRRPVWHPAAGLFTLGWLVFRRLWAEALVYGALVLALLGLGGWAWPVLQTWPPGVRWGVLGSLLLLGVLVPGLLGYGLVHRQLQRRLLRVVAAATSMDGARAALARQAPTRRGLWGAVAAQAALLGGLLLAAPGPVWWTVVAAPAVATPERDGPAAQALPSSLSGAVPPPAVTIITAQRLDAQTVPAAAVEAPSAADPRVSPWPAAEEPASAVVTPPAVRGDARTVPPDRAAATAWVAPARKTSEPVAVFAINVGLFADAGNARRAQERLQQAGLPVVVQAIGTAQGPRTRVRVGPYPQRGAADAAARRIRALGLDAVVFRAGARP